MPVPGKTPRTQRPFLPAPKRYSPNVPASTSLASKAGHLYFSVSKCCSFTFFHPRFGDTRSTLLASSLVIAGAFAWLYVFVIGGQAFPLDIFPGYAASSSFADGAIGQYAPTLPELLLGLGGAGAAFLVTVIGARVLEVLPRKPASTQPGSGVAAH